jgi:hypothetical protein
VIIIRHSAVQLTTTANKNQVHYNTVSLAKNCLKRTELLRPHCVGRGSRTSRGPVATSQHLRWGLLGRDGYVPRGPAAGPQYLLYYSCLSTWTNKMWGDFWLKSGEGAQKTTDRGILQQCSLSASVLHFCTRRRADYVSPQFGTTPQLHFEFSLAGFRIPRFRTAMNS